jgi:histidyl-tRNA synthetase
MSSSISPIRGINDILPEETPAWQWIEAVVRDTVQAYGYREIRLPLMERTELFARSIGEVTDIVEKEMYTFEDRNGDSLSLRPEATASCVRAGISHGLFHNAQPRLWYSGPMFRYERPQKGRYRQFHQIGAEAFGLAGPDIDAELILICGRIWSRLGLTDITLELNSLGTPESRAEYRDLLVNYFSDHYGQLDEDSRRRLGQNPLRILDSKNPEMADLVAGAPEITEHLDPESADHFAALRGMLEDAGLEYRINPRLVRGLDYYTRTVFEWTTDRLGAQSAVCSGGRYDGLVSQLGGRATPAIGWALGMERLVELVRDADLAPGEERPHAYLVPLGDVAERRAQALAESLRDDVPDLRLWLHCGGGGMKSRMKRADRSGAGYALILGDAELEAASIVMKPLRSHRDQETVPLTDLPDRLRQLCGEASQE